MSKVFNDIKRTTYEFTIKFVDGSSWTSTGKFMEIELQDQCKKLAAGFGEKIDNGFIFYPAQTIRKVIAKKVETKSSGESTGKTPDEVLPYNAGRPSQN